MRYPLFLDLANQPVVVIGAGTVATRKIRTLLRAGALVTVISPAATLAIQRLVGASSPPAWPKPLRRGEGPPRSRSERDGDTAPTRPVRWVRRRYRPGDLRGAWLVVAATNDLAVNRRVCAEAKRRRLLVNCIAPPSAGNFIVPSLVRCGRVQIAISTGGASPALAKRLRQELERFVARGYPALRKRMTRERRRKR